MADNDIDLGSLYEARKNRFRVLVCVDGSEESYGGLEYAGSVANLADSDIVLLYVRPIDQGLRSGGLQVRVARENMLNWGLELPGIKYLKKGLNQLMADETLATEWGEKMSHTDIEGDPLGDNKIEYTNEDGRAIVLKLKTASTIAAGILDQYELGPYNLIILGESGSWGGWAKSLWDPAVAEKVAMYAPCSVLITRDLKRGNGYLLCTDGSNRAIEMVKKAGLYAMRTRSNVSVMSVALDVESEPDAQKNVDAAVAVFKDMGVEPKDTFTRVGNPFEEINRAGEDYAIIAVGDTGKTGLKRFFLGSVSFKVMEHAKKSVMVIR